VFVLIVLGGMSVAWLVLLFLAPVARLVPSVAPYTQALTYAITGLLALVYPAWRWRTQGLLPDTPTAEQQPRLLRGERAIAIGHGLFVVGFVAPLIGVAVLQEPEDAFMTFYAASFVAVPLSLLLWSIGLYLVSTAERWR
jgi:cytochrome b561